MAGESYMKNGKRVTRQFDLRMTVSTSGGGVLANPPSAFIGSISKIYQRLGDEDAPNVVLEDLNSYRNTLQSPTAMKNDPPGLPIIMSGTSVDDSIKGLDEATSDFDGICFCTSGFVDSAHPNVVAFPPAGVVAHYKLYERDHHLGLSLVEYLGVL